ncbi:MAG: hypothetical protein GEU73_02485 [Chloroflexi bacterium]|nr:hypothetical protein [Chloroflexota bacterium]
MLNPASLLSLGAMVLFLSVAGYVVLRSARDAVALAAAGALVATAAYLLGQGMQANADTLEAWVSWTRSLQWGAVVAPTLWYWVTAVLLRETRPSAASGYRRWALWPLGVAFTAASVFLVVAIYVDDWLYQWSAVFPLSPERAGFSAFGLPNGPLYAWFVALLAGTTLAASVNVLLGVLGATGRSRRRFAWLLVSAVLFVFGANSLGIVNWLGGWIVPTWAGHLTLGVALVIMGWNVSAHRLIVDRRP